MYAQLSFILLLIHLLILPTIKTQSLHSFLSFLFLIFIRILHSITFIPCSHPYPHAQARLVQNDSMTSARIVKAQIEKTTLGEVAE